VSEGCGAQFMRGAHSPSPVGSRRPIHPGAVDFVEQRLARRLVLPMQRRRPATEVLRPGADGARGELDVRRC
jgi:hypothetical protein